MDGVLYKLLILSKSSHYRIFPPSYHKCIPFCNVLSKVTHFLFYQNIILPSFLKSMNYLFFNPSLKKYELFNFGNASLSRWDPFSTNNNLLTFFFYLSYFSNYTFKSMPKANVHTFLKWKEYNYFSILFYSLFIQLFYLLCILPCTHYFLKLCVQKKCLTFGGTEEYYIRLETTILPSFTFGMNWINHPS